MQIEESIRGTVVLVQNSVCAAWTLWSTQFLILFLLMTDPNNECCDQLAGLPNAKLPYLENENGQEELFYSPSLLASFTHVHVAEIVR